MAILQRASYGFLLRHPVQLLLALLGIATGVAVIVAVDLANSSADTAFRLSVDAVTGAATHQIVGGPAGVDESLYTELRVEHGVSRIAPVIEGLAEWAGATVQVLGIDPFAEREFRNYVATTSGNSQQSFTTLLTDPGAVLVASGRAAAAGLSAGDSFTLRVGGVERSAIFAGSFDSAGREAQLADLLITDIATAQSWFSLHGRLTRIDVRRDTAPELHILRALLPPGVQLLSAAGRTAAVTQMSRAFSVNLTAMSLLALLVGIFLIFNSVSFAVVQRRSMISILRALGLTRAGLFRLILSEALLLGLAGSVLGFFCGIWLGESLLQLVSQSLNDLYFRNSVTDVVITSTTVVKGVGAGLLATCVAALLPALEATSYTPRLGMQRASLERRAGDLLWKLALAGLLFAIAVVPLLRYSEQSLVAGLLSLFVLILGIALSIPFLMQGVLKFCAWLAGLCVGHLARHSVAGIGANLSRTGVAIVALSVAVSATVGVSIMVSSFRVAVSDWIDNTLQADMYVAPASGSLQPRLARDLRRIDGVAAASSSRRVWLESPRGRTRLVVLDMAPRSYAGIDLIESIGEDVWHAFDEEGAVLASESYAYRYNARPGDVVALPTERGERAFQIGGIYRSYDAQAETIIMSRAIYELFWDDTAIDTMGLYLADDAKPEGVAAAVLALAQDRQALQVRSNTELRELSLAIFDRTFLITNVLYWLAVSVAVVGILGALLALQLERSRELATLRALGVTRAQLGGMVSLQSAMIGLMSGLCALPLGLLMARLLIEVINRRAFGWTMPVVIDMQVLWTALLLATGAALAAGIYPAWRASHSQPALAMRED
ncbi:MAG: FtsX-like permease family protein [Woeseia sp.]